MCMRVCVMAVGSTLSAEAYVCMYCVLLFDLHTQIQQKYKSVHTCARMHHCACTVSWWQKGAGLELSHLFQCSLLAAVSTMFTNQTWKEWGWGAGRLPRDSSLLSSGGSLIVPLFLLEENRSLKARELSVIFTEKEYLVKPNYWQFKTVFVWPMIRCTIKLWFQIKQKNNLGQVWLTQLNPISPLYFLLKLH